MMSSSRTICELRAVPDQVAELVNQAPPVLDLVCGSFLRSNNIGAGL